MNIGGLRPRSPRDFNDTLLKILASPNVCSKEWIIRQYDHEVQGGSVIKPLVGVRDDGPGDAAVVMPVLGSWTGLAVGCGINPHYGDLDPYAMAAAAIDEAVRNVVAVGADPAADRPARQFLLGQHRSAGGAGFAGAGRRGVPRRRPGVRHAVHQRQGQPEKRISRRRPPHRHSADAAYQRLGRVPDVRRCVTMDLKEPGNILYLLGTTQGGDGRLALSSRSRG